MKLFQTYWPKFASLHHVVSEHGDTALRYLHDDQIRLDQLNRFKVYGNAADQNRFVIAFRKVFAYLIIRAKKRVPEQQNGPLCAIVISNFRRALPAAVGLVLDSIQLACQRRVGVQPCFRV